MSAATSKPLVYLSSISSDIGIALARRYARDGYAVAGTYRSDKLLDEIKDIPDLHVSYCDLSDPESVKNAAREFQQTGLTWETFLSLASWPPPLCAFFEGDFDEWSRSVHVNAIEQLRALHSLFPFRACTGNCNAVFFAGPGTNNAVLNFSALTVSKIMLIKMCELIQAECPSLNTFIVGPGWTKTKTHDLILSDPKVSPEKKRETEAFLARGGGTSMDEIYDCIRWLCAAGPKAAGGRNFSVVHDCWGDDGLQAQLLMDNDMYKLRRSGNLWKQRKTN